MNKLFGLSDRSASKSHHTPRNSSVGSQQGEYIGLPNDGTEGNMTDQDLDDSLDGIQTQRKEELLSDASLLSEMSPQTLDSPKVVNRNLLLGARIERDAPGSSSSRRGSLTAIGQTASQLIGKVINVTPKPGVPVRSIMRRRTLVQKRIGHTGNSVKVDKSSNEPRWFIMKRNSMTRAVLDTFFDIIVAVSVLMGLYFLGFKQAHGPQIVVDELIRVVFIFEIALNFFTSVYDNHMQQIFDMKFIAEEYLKGWFPPDFIAVLPWGAMTGYWDIEYILRILIRMVKIPNALNMLDGRGIGLVIMKLQNRKNSRAEQMTPNFIILYLTELMQLLIKAMLAAYALGWFWFWYVKQVDNEPNAVENFIKHNFDLDDISLGEQVLHSCYFILTTISTVGYGDYLPKNMYEQALLWVIMLVGVVWFAYIMGSFNSVIEDFNSLTGEQDNLSNLNIWIDELENFAFAGQYKKLPQDLKKEIIEHHCYYWAHDRLKFMAKRYWMAQSYDELWDLKIEYLQEMPPEMARNIIDYLFEDIFYKFRTFFGPENDFKQAICFHFQPRKFEVGEVIIEEGEQVGEVLLVTEGSVGLGPILHGVQQTILTYGRHKDGNYVLGLHSALTYNGAVTSYKVRGEKPIKALAIPRRPLLDVVQHKFPETRIHLIKLAKKINNDIKRSVHVDAYKATSKITAQTGQWLKQEFSPLIHELSKKDSILTQQLNIQPPEIGIQEAWTQLTEDIGEAQIALDDFYEHDKVFKKQKKDAVEEFIKLIS